MINYSCDECQREFSRHCKRCLHTADKVPTKFKRKKKTGCQTPEYRCPTMPPVKPMYALNLYVTLEDLNNYIRNNVDTRFKDATFIPVDITPNWHDLSFDILLLSPNFQDDDDGCRYKIDLNKEN